MYLYLCIKESKVLNNKGESIMEKNKNVNVELISLDKIINPVISMRTDNDEDNLVELMESIKKVGLLNPITVNRTGETYEIIAGHRRYLAYKAMKEKIIPAFVWESTESEVLYARIAENIDRKQVSIVDEAMYLNSVRIAMKMKSKELAKFIRRSEAYVSERLSINEYNDMLLSALKEGHISFSVAREFNRVKDKQQLYYFLKYAIKGGCSPSQAHEWVQDYLKSTTTTEVTLTPETEDEPPEQKLAPEFKYPCSICRGHFLPANLTAYQLCPECHSEILKI